MEPSKISLPKGYLSWSQLDVWRRNPDRYKEEYFYDLPKLDTKYLRFGKWFAKEIEKGRHKKYFPDLPVYDKFEHKMEIELDGVKLLSYIDSCHPEEHVFLEYKTGKAPWSLKKVQKHDQLAFYALGLYKLTGKMPEYCDLVWLETAEIDESKMKGLYNIENEGIYFTGRMEVYRRYFDIRELERIEAEIIKSATDISQAYQKLINEI